MDRLFLNFDAGFDAENLRSKALKLGIIPNIDHNKRNSATDNDHYFDQLSYKDIPQKEQTYGWIASVQYLIDLIHSNELDRVQLFSFYSDSS